MSSVEEEEEEEEEQEEEVSVEDKDAMGEPEFHRHFPSYIRSDAPIHCTPPIDDARGECEISRTWRLDAILERPGRDPKSECLLRLKSRPFSSNHSFPGAHRADRLRDLFRRCKHVAKKKDKFHTSRRVLTRNSEINRYYSLNFPGARDELP